MSESPFYFSRVCFFFFCNFLSSFVIGPYVKYMQKWLMKYALFVVDKYCRALRLENRSVARVKCVAKPRLDNNVFVFLQII